MSAREVFTPDERKALAADILKASSIKATSIAASLNIGPSLLSRWKGQDYDEKPSLDDLVLLEAAAQTTVLCERLRDFCGTPDRSQLVLRILRLNAQLATALETGDVEFIDRLENAMTGSAA